jgi:hypothetical protein
MNNHVSSSSIDSSFNRPINLNDLKNIGKELPSLPQEVGAPLSKEELLSKEYYDQLFNNYIEYMSTMLNN